VRCKDACRIAQIGLETPANINFRSLIPFGHFRTAGGGTLKFLDKHDIALTPI